MARVARSVKLYGVDKHGRGPRKRKQKRKPKKSERPAACQMAAPRRGRPRTKAERDRLNKKHRRYPGIDSAFLSDLEKMSA